jgi:hypothetical protein
MDLSTAGNAFCGREARARTTKWRKHHAKPDTTVVSARFNTVAPPHAAVQIPVVMAAAAQSAFRAWTEVWTAVARDGLEIFGAHVLAPLPNIAGHVIQAELIRRLGTHGVRVRSAWQQLPGSVGQAPSGAPAQKATRV